MADAPTTEAVTPDEPSFPQKIRSYGAFLRDSHENLSDAELGVLLKGFEQAAERVEQLQKWGETMEAMFHDKIVGEQAAYIEWKHGKGADEAMGWIANGLDGPGLIPHDDEPYSRDAQKYYSANKSNPFPRCAVCGDPSFILWMGKGFCSEDHHKQVRSTSDPVTTKP